MYRTNMTDYTHDEHYTANTARCNNTQHTPPSFLPGVTIITIHNKDGELKQYE